jgi:glutamine synthetase
VTEHERLANPMPVLSNSELDSIAEELATAGVDLLVGSIVDPAGVARSKQAPAGRADVYHRSGLGASPTWNVFCIDNTIAFTPDLTVVGDLRLRADLLAHRRIGNGIAWVPTELFTQDGQSSPLCSRGLLRRFQASFESQGLSVRAGSELEFVLTQADGSALPTRHWSAYGLAPALDTQDFLRELLHACANADLPVEQVHAEYGDEQFEFSIAPTDPMTAADNVVLARLLAGQVARRHGMAVSFSPLPFAGGAGNGAHVHLSVARDGVPLFSGGEGPHGVAADGAAMMGGIVAGLPESLGILAGSVLSAHRLTPNRWAGAFACWGWENREAAVRFCANTRGNPHGASIEIKCIDPSANPYLVLAVLLGLALDGLAEDVALPPEVTRNPAELSTVETGRTGTVRLPANQTAALDALAGSRQLRALLGNHILDAVLAVRRHEQDTYGKEDLVALADRFRFAWSL